MKRTFKTLGLFMSALFLLTACSSDDDKYNLGSFTVPFEEVVNTTKADCVVGSWLEKEAQKRMSMSHASCRVLM